jgi:hypothetical protein
MDQESYKDQFICRIVFSSGGDSAYHDVLVYGLDRGYGHPSNFIDDDNHSEYWNVYLTCPDLPLVLRMANNHGGRIEWWNTRFLEEPTMTIPFFVPEKPKEEKKGCYVATAVYGSYDCPEVWTLRRYRDNTLDRTLFGKLFIRLYYLVSPTMVKWFGRSMWFKSILRRPLDRFVNRLLSNGVENTPYTDKY